MSLSPFFHSLRASYQSEIDDLTSDSEGRDVLRQRLAAKRREIGFLVQMMEISPEMVAVAFHQGFRITQPQVMEHLVTLEPDDFPPWDSLTDSFEWQPWARDLAAVVLQVAAKARPATSTKTMRTISACATKPVPTGWPSRVLTARIDPAMPFAATSPQHRRTP